MKPNPMSQLTRRDFMRLTGAGALTAGAAGFATLASPGAAYAEIAESESLAGGTVTSDRVIADPTDIPGPISRTEPRTHDILLTAEERVAEVMPGVQHRFMTFNGQVPGPMIRVRVGDTVNLTLRNAPENGDAHSIDLHAVYGSGGGASYTEVAAGKEKTITFKATYPGGFIYHCGVSNFDMHVSRGMFGMIVVEPEEGLPPVDREFYLGQHELYTKGRFGVPGLQEFNDKAMLQEDPNYVLFNGAVYGLTEKEAGPMQAKVGETVRVFAVVGGPNLSSALHPIGNVWSRYWPQGAIMNDPLRYVQTAYIPSGSGFVGDMELPVPETIRIVDHAASRALNKGAAADLVVSGSENPEVFQAG